MQIFYLLLTIVNYILPDNASGKERAKYNICKAILFYQNNNNIPDEKLAKTLEVNKDKLIDILFAKIYNLELSELTYFASEKLKIRNVDLNFYECRLSYFK